MENNNKETTLAYIAGLYDGDGSFSICKKKPEADGRAPLYYPLIQICKSNRLIIDFIANYFDGRVYRTKSVFKNGSPKRDIYHLHIEKQERCRKFVEQIAPYLQIKRQQAEYMLKFIQDNPFKRGIHVSDESIGNREQFYNNMRKLNEKRDKVPQLSSRSARKNSENPIFWAYLSGLMDTDGSFSIKREKHKTNCNHAAHSPVICLSMMNIKAIDYIRRNCAYGSFCLTKTVNKQSFCYRFAICVKSEAIEFLNKCIPFLIGKKKNALVLLSFCENFIRCNGSAGLDMAQLEFREQCYNELIKLNDGVYKSSLIDSELLPGSAGDDEGQAGNTVQAERPSAKTSTEDAPV